MDASACSHTLTEANPVARHGAKACSDAASEDLDFNDRPRQRNAGEADVPDEDRFTTFVGGDGI
jgi:hypothetical protein